VRAQKAMA